MTFSVAASGTAPLSYQWLRNGQEQAGATSDSFTLTSPQLADSQSKLSVRVSNAAGSTTSDIATLVVMAAVDPRLSFVAGDISYGNGEPQMATAKDGVGAAARFGGIVGMAADAAGNLYVADPWAVRKIAAGGVVTTLAGGITRGSVDGTGSAAQFTQLSGIAVDAAGNVYVSDTNGLRKITSSGMVSTLALVATGAPTSEPQLRGPGALAIDAAGNIYVVDTGDDVANMGWLIRKVAPNGVVSNGPGGPFSGGTVSTFQRAGKIAVDGLGNVYVAMTQETASFCTGSCWYYAKTGFVRKIEPNGMVSVFAGSEQEPVGAVDGPAQAARFNFPSDIAVDPSGNVFVADVLNHAVRKITSTGVSTIVGTLPAADASGQSSGAIVLGPLPGGLKWPNAIALGPNGSLYITAGVTQLQYIPRVTGVAVLRADLP